jgi:hypothetical protein
LTPIPRDFRIEDSVPNWIEGYLLELNGMFTRATGILLFALVIRIREEKN